ncbi:FCD domain-containing protein [Streptomyces violaceus]|uniref:FCD domain-containing protein n=1 Tax=Streptomyces violaceus TaxID=1936 RepID=UPI003CD0BDFC
MAFHDRILQASHNRLGRSIIRILHAQARTTFLYNGTPDETACRQANEEHRAVAERLLARTPRVPRRPWRRTSRPRGAAAACRTPARPPPESTPTDSPPSQTGRGPSHVQVRPSRSATY